MISLRFDVVLAFNVALQESSYAVGFLRYCGDVTVEGQTESIVRLLPFYFDLNLLTYMARPYK